MKRRLVLLISSRWGLVILWSLAIFTGSSIPGVSVSPYELIDFLIHKSVHLLEYSLLSVLTYNASRSWRVTLVYAALFAASDEAHQLFVPGRQGRLTDWLVDLAAVGLGGLALALWRRRREKGAVVTDSPEATGQAAAALLTHLRGGRVLALVGELGSGKTVFVQGLARALGVAAPVTSPTFNLIKEYPLWEGPANPGFQRLVHVDLYRLEERQTETLGLEDYFNDPQSLVVIEWADRLGAGLPAEAVSIVFTYQDEQHRRLEVKYH